MALNDTREMVCRVNEFGLVCGYTDVEIVRCRDCAHFEESEPAGCTLLDFAAPSHADGFCAWGIPADSGREIPNRGLNHG